MSLLGDHFADVRTAPSQTDLHDTGSFTRLSSTLPLEASLKQLFRREACSDEAFFDYELTQALRGLTHAVKSNRTVPLPAVDGRHVSRGATSPLAVHNSAEASSQSAPAPAARCMTGSALALWRMSCACLQSAAYATTALYLSTKLLCDSASAYGEGNDRPCCTREWTDALLSLAPAAVWGSVSASLAEAKTGPVAAHNGSTDGTVGMRTLVSQAAVDRRLQLGYLILLSGTLRMVACEHVPGKRLTLDYAQLVQGVLQDVIPNVALASGAEDTSEADPQRESPSRLPVEVNHFVVQCFQWIAMDTLSSHSELSHETAGEARKRTGPRMLDRDVPALLWFSLSHFRNAMVRCLKWCREEALPATGGLIAQENGEMVSSPPQNHTSSMRTVPIVIEQVLGKLVAEHERLTHARLSVARQYGETAKDYHLLSDALWSSTLRLCVVVREVAGAFTAAQGGLTVASTSSHLVLRTDRDVLMHVASAVVRVPALQSKETEADVLSATASLLSAAVAIAAAAPVLSLQAAIWGADVSVTRQVHAALVQRALHYRDEVVLKLASLLSASVVYALAPSASAVASSIAAESSEQLLDMLAESRDAASQCAVDMLTRAVAERPHSLLPSLFRLLHHGSPEARRNTLDVLAGLPRYCADNHTHNSEDNSRTAKSRETLRLLAENLLLHLQDEELCLRLQSAALFDKVWPEDVLRPLLTRCLSRDSTGRKQAAAYGAVESVMTAHTEDADVVLLLLQECLSLLDSASGTDTMPRQTTGVSSTTDGVVAPQPQFTTPGDILSHTLLYSTDTLAASPDEEPQAQDDSLIAPAASAGAPTSTTVAKHEKLRDRVLTLATRFTLVWARHVSHWDAQAHLSPLLLYLAQTGRDASTPSPSGRTDHQGFIWRCLTGLIAHITIPVSQGNSTAAGAVLASICDVFFEKRDGASVSDPPCATSTEGATFPAWLAQTEEWARLEHTGNDAKHRNVTNAVLAPLLCLRACHEGLMAPLTSSAAADSSLEVDTADGAHVARLRRVWHTLWTALTSAPYSGGFNDIPEAQRVVLDVLTRFPSETLFTTLRRLASTDARDMDAVFAARIFTFALCSYISRGSPVCDVEAAVSRCGELDDICECLVLPWMLDKGGGCTDAAPASTTHTNTQLQRLSLSVIDGYALLAARQLDGRQTTPTGDDNGTGWVSSTFLHEFATLFRTVSARTQDDEAPPSEVTRAPVWLAKFQLHQLVQRRLLDLLQHQKTPSAKASQQGTDAEPRQARYTRWCNCFFPCLIELANAATAACLQPPSPSLTTDSSAASLTAEAEDVAVQCTELLFFAVMAARHFTTKSLNDSGPRVGEASDTVVSPLQKLSFSDKEALVQFAVGTTRYSKSAAIQQSGVKLLSALFGVAPDLFAEVSEASRSQGLRTPSSMLQDGAEALYSVSLMHPDPLTRRTAEQVCQLLGGAAVKGLPT